MTGDGPTDDRVHPTPDDGGPVATEVPPATDRSARFTLANMLRSLLPLIVIVLAVVAWTTFRQTPDVDPVKPAENLDSTVSLAANRAGYPLPVPTDLPGGYVATSARTDAGDAGEGDPVTLQIGYVTPAGEFAGFVVSDDPRADAVTALLGDATEGGTLKIAGETWTRSTRLHERDTETVLSRERDGVTVVISGSASDEELETVAAALAPYPG
ncbi:DUF4245 domain-containing protein [Geodermatophilus sp. URMC 64]